MELFVCVSLTISLLNKYEENGRQGERGRKKRGQRMFGKSLSKGEGRADEGGWTDGEKMGETTTITNEKRDGGGRKERKK